MIKPSRKTGYKKIDPGKKQCQNFHARKRAKERLGIKLTDELTDQIVSCIKNEEKKNDLFEVEFLEEQSKRIKHYLIKFKGKDPVKVVYDCHRKTIVTFLFNQEEDLIHHYIDIFGNRISTKHDFGKTWALKEKDLVIPGEEVIYDDENDCWFVQEGTLKNKYFRLIDEFLTEIFPPKGT